MSQFNPTGLLDVTNRTVSAGVIPSADHENFRNDVESRIADLNDLALALATMQSGTADPFSLQGSVWYDTTNSLWKGDPAGSGHTDIFATDKNAYARSFATASTATFRIGGRLGTDTTQTTKASNANAAFTQKTITGNTLDHDGAYIYAFFGGTKSANNGTLVLQVRFGGTAIGSHSIPVVGATVSPWVVEAWIFRTGAATQKAFSVIYPNRDDTGSTSLVVYNAGLGKTLSADQTLDLLTNGSSAADNVVQEAMMWEYHG